MRRKIVSLHDTPHRIALGSAIGVFIAWLPLIGMQTLLSIGVSKALRANVLASIPWSWLTNPLNAVPFYYAHYRLALLILPKSDGVGRDRFNTIFSNLDATGAQLTGWNRWTHGLFESFRLLSEVFWPIALGTTLIGIPVAIVSYFLIRRAVAAVQSRRLKRLELWSRRSDIM